MDERMGFRTIEMGALQIKSEEGRYAALLRELTLVESICDSKE